MDVAGTTRYAGTRVPRVEDERLLTGHGTFVDDVTRPGLLHACFVRSPFARARIEGIDVTEALAAPGVVAVFLAADLAPRLHELWWSAMGPKVPTTPMPPLAEGEVCFVGDPVALVVADDRYRARDAAELVEVDYDPLPPVVDHHTAHECEHLVHADFPANLVGEMAGGSAEAVDEAVAGAAHVVRTTVRQQAYAAAPMETRGTIVEWSAADERLTIWAATQAPHEVRSVAGRVLGLDEEQIRVIMRDTGGGFGQKVVPLREEVCLFLAAGLVDGPLKWIEERRENLMAAGQARHESGELTLALDGDGTILGARIDHLQDVGAYPIPWPVGTGSAVGMLFPGPYRMPATAFTHRSVFTNTQGRTAYRGPWAFETLAREVLLDVAARQAGLDPVEVRRRNLLTPADLPYTNGNGMPYMDIDPRATFEHALDLLDLDAFRREQAEAREAGRYLGLGLSTYVEPTTAGFGFYANEGARIAIDPSGQVTIAMSGGSTGNSLETTAVQLTADALGLDLADVVAVQGDTDRTPFGAGTGGSRSGGMAAGAIATTAAVVRARLAELAAERLEAAAEDIELADSRAFVRGTPAVGVTVAELATMAGGIDVTETYTAPSPLPLWANATHVCTCEVDTETGLVTLLRYIVAEDCGPMINPSVVEGQIAGGTIQGIAGVLYEELAHDEDGNPLATTLADYRVPSAVEAPTIEYGHDVATPSSGPGGYKGVGEGGAIGAPPAVVNAVADALAPFGVTLTDLPLSPETVLRAINSEIV